MSRPDEAAAPLHIESRHLRTLAIRLLEHAGTPTSHAESVVDHLLEASAMGLASHGVIRVPQYLAEIASHELDPRAEATIVSEHGAIAQVDGHGGFGQVAGAAMVRRVSELAREHGVAIVVGRRLGHTGRVGAYPEALARLGLIGVAVCSGPPSGHWVAPFGGRDGRVATNPIGFAYPVDSGPAVVGDFSTAATAEGVIRSFRNRGLAAPTGFLRDAQGRLTDNPDELYASPRGAIQPFGGAQGYRGTALALLVEVLATLLAGDAVADASRIGTNMTVIAIEPEPGFASLAADLSDYVRSSSPIDPTRPVMMPGDRERATADSGGLVPVDRPTERALVAEAQRAGIDVPWEATAQPGPPPEPAT